MSFKQFRPQELFLPGKLKWKISHNKLARPVAVYFGTCVSLVRDWLVSFVLVSCSPILELLVCLSPHKMCVTTLTLNLQPGYCGCWLALEVVEGAGAWSPET